MAEFGIVLNRRLALSKATVGDQLCAGLNCLLAPGLRTAIEWAADFMALATA